MNVLLVSATHLEIMPLLQRCDWPSGWGPVYSTMIGKHTVDVLLSGPGVVAASYQLGTLLGMRRYDLAVQAGIAGSFRQEIAPGKVVHIKQDILADFGSSSPDGFLPAASIGLLESSAYDTSEGHLLETAGISWPESVTAANGITVQQVSGTEADIASMRKHFDPDTESMEGAAFYFACRMHRLPAAQLRSISNLVEPRNKENWNIPLAVAQLDVALQLLFEELL